MNKKLNQFFEKDLVLKIISILIGVLLWFIVLDQQNPLMERTISIPLRSNREVLESNNISLVSSNVPSTVDVVIRGRKQRIEKVSSNDFQAYLDFSSITDTETTEVPINLPEYIGDQDVIVLDVYPKLVKIKLENIVRKEFPVSVKWTGQLPEGYDAVNVKANPNTIILEDLESVVNNISSVAVTVDRQQLLEGTLLTGVSRSITKAEKRVSDRIKPHGQCCLQSAQNRSRNHYGYRKTEGRLLCQGFHIVPGYCPNYRGL